MRHQRCDVTKALRATRDLTEDWALAAGERHETGYVAASEARIASVVAGLVNEAYRRLTRYDEAGGQ